MWSLYGGRFSSRQRMIVQTHYRVRFRLSVGDGCAFEDVNGLYISIEDHEALLKREDAQRIEAQRIISLATMRYPLALTESQCRDAHRWLTEDSKHG
jgi:hypothetical protein